MANLYLTSTYTENMMGSLDKETNAIAFEWLSLILMGYFEGELNWEGSTFMSFFATGFLETRIREMPDQTWKCIHQPGSGAYC